MNNLNILAATTRKRKRIKKQSKDVNDESPHSTVHGSERELGGGPIKRTALLICNGGSDDNSDSIYQQQKTEIQTVQSSHRHTQQRESTQSNMVENAEILVGMAVNGVEGQANSNNEEKSEDEDEDEDEEQEEEEEEEEAKYDEVEEDDEKERKLGSPLLAAEEESEDEGLDEVVHEHKVRLQELREKEAKSAPVTIENSCDLDKRMEYLMAQSEIFTHFLDSARYGNKDNSKKKGGRTRMKESEEDSILMQQAQSKAHVTRVSQQPGLIQGGTMRNYQLEGLNWMIKLHDNGINGILADEMGLGKTLQSISLLAFLREVRHIRGPHLIVVPKSTTGNWMKEFRTWCPEISVIKLLGNKEDRHQICENILRQGKFDVCVTSYECVLKEKSTLTRIRWRYLMIDEAHRIKNEKSVLSQQVRHLKTQFRLLITGTPLQNNLHELWALLNFLMPDVFRSSDDFDKWFNVTGDASAQDNVIRRLHTILRPFMLRRVKSDVEKDLPPKIETKLYIGLTKMQREWYKRVLSKDAHTLNALGGPDRVRLLNVLMQLRKVCNHPYLFDGAEPGPPYINGPHLWENTGKMILLEKLLPKLKQQGSRVLIFCQMTRLLDILEDYMHMKGYHYCRIDGSTDGEARDSQMTEFNEPGSPKFIFLLSTRAGGLGINLQTADTVFLFDSDWNPQADLQAMDRAHRIGQTKVVRVFRFICEGTVEEKIVERADRKLFLDAAVIQQGRLAEKHSQLGKQELMAMVRFGADDILRTDDAGVTDEDIDALLAKGEKRTAEVRSRIADDMKHNLANFKLLDDDETNLFAFEGEDYKKKTTDNLSFINLPQRERKRGYEKSDRPPPKEKKKRGPVIHDFQFFYRPRYEAILEREAQLAEQRNTIASLIRELRARSKKNDHQTGGDNDPESEALRLEEDMEQLVLSSSEKAERDRLLEEAFPDWTRKDLRYFVAAMERLGRQDKDTIVHEVSLESGKSEDYVARYYDVFWDRYTEISDYGKMLERIQKGEKRIQRGSQMRAALEKKIARYLDPLQTLTINYGGNKGRSFSEEEDVFLINMMHRHGYGAWEIIRSEIRRSWRFRFDWFFKSRNALDLQRRADTLIRLVEKENEELEKNGGVKKRKISQQHVSTSVSGGGISKRKKSDKK